MALVASWSKDFVERAFGTDDGAMQRKVWKWLKPIWVALALATSVLWLGTDLDTGVQKKLSQLLPGMPLESIRFLAPYVLGSLLLYLAWHAGIAFDHSHGASIWMSRIETDDGYGFFQFSVQNRGTGQVTARAYATEATDHSGTKIPGIDGEVELHCRGVGKGEPMILAGNRQIDVVVCHVQQGTGQASAHVLLATPEDRALGGLGKYGLRALNAAAPVPLGEQDPIYLTVRIDCFEAIGHGQNSKEQKLLLSKVVRLAIIPDTRAPLKYRVRPARWWIFE